MERGLQRAIDRPLSRRLPPIDAWRQPDKWLDPHTGLLLKPMRQRLVHPVDENGLILPEIAIAELKSHLWDDFVPEVDKNDPELRLDSHHLYHSLSDYLPGTNDGSLIPWAFRRLRSNLLVNQRQIHNMWHDMYSKPMKPREEVMEELVKADILATRALNKAARVAHDTAALMPHFNRRRNDIARHPERIGNREYDDIGEEYLRNKFSARYNHLQETLTQLEELPHVTRVYPDMEITRKRPALIAGKLGPLATRRALDYTHHFPACAA